MRPDLSVVIPCYNEEKNIPEILERFGKALAGKNAELILVDNGSTDGTGSAIDAGIRQMETASAKKATVVKNQGYGFGILSGLKEAKGNILAWTHADLQTDPEDVVRAWRLYEEKAASGGKILVKGRRLKRPPFDVVFTFGMQLYAGASLGVSLEDINAQPKLFGRDFYEAVRDSAPHDFSLDLYWLYKARKLGYKIETCPVYFRSRRFGQAKGGGGGIALKWKLTKRTFAYIHALRQTSR